MTWIRTHPWLTVAIVLAILALIWTLQYVAANVGGETPGSGLGELITS
jgi:PDZ domain-containing secreted protein